MVNLGTDMLAQIHDIVKTFGTSEKRFDVIAARWNAHFAGKKLRLVDVDGKEFPLNSLDVAHMLADVGMAAMSESFGRLIPVEHAERVLPPNNGWVFTRGLCLPGDLSVGDELELLNGNVVQIVERCLELPGRCFVCSDDMHRDGEKVSAYRRVASA